MREAGAEIIPVDTGSKTLVDAVVNVFDIGYLIVINSHMGIGSCWSKRIFKNLRIFNRTNIKRIKKQLLEEFGEIPKIKTN